MITIYGRPGCGACANIKNILEKRGISFTYIDINSMDERGRDRLLQDAENAGIMALPIFVKDGIIVSITEALK